MSTFKPKGLVGKIGVKGTLVFKNAAGQVIKTVEMNGAIPISKLGMTEDQARDFVHQHQQQEKRS